MPASSKKTSLSFIKMTFFLHINHTLPSIVRVFSGSKRWNVSWNRLLSHTWYFSSFVPLTAWTHMEVLVPHRLEFIYGGKSIEKGHTSIGFLTPPQWVISLLIWAVVCLCWTLWGRERITCCWLYLQTGTCTGWFLADPLTGGHPTSTPSTSVSADGLWSGLILYAKQQTTKTPDPQIIRLFLTAFVDHWFRALICSLYYISFELSCWIVCWLKGREGETLQMLHWLLTRDFISQRWFSSGSYVKGRRKTHCVLNTPRCSHLYLWQGSARTHGHRFNVTVYHTCLCSQVIEERRTLCNEVNWGKNATKGAGARF